MDQAEAPGATPALNPLTFIPGCNTPADVTRAQLIVNVERDIPWLELEPLKDRPLAIVAGGPSLKERWYEIESHGGEVLALNNAYGFLVDKGIAPDYFMLLDARADNVAFLRTAHGATRHFIAAQCHPDVFEALSGFQVTLYLTIMPESLELTAHIDKPKHRIAGTVGTVGIKALCLAYALGYRELHLYGYDSSYADGEHHAFPQALNDQSKTIEVYLDGKRYVTTPTLAHQTSEFCTMASGMARMGFDINLHCDGLLPRMVEYSNREGERPLELREREKYEKMWAQDRYRETAPGEKHAADAALQFAAKPGGIVIDFGCGSGRGAQYLQDHGFRVIGIDFAANCRDTDCDFPFVQACLWDLPQIFGDFGYCTDVMEHIPTEKVPDVLQGIADRVHACYFNIATCQDNCGRLIGKKLHMTVMGAESWEKLLKAHWSHVTLLGKTDEQATFICKHLTTQERN